jgi:hypothetical protein
LILPSGSFGFSKLGERKGIFFGSINSSFQTLESKSYFVTSPLNKKQRRAKKMIDKVMKRVEMYNKGEPKEDINKFNRIEKVKLY